MASIVNADNGSVSGSAGLKSSADSSGVLALQTNGTTAVTVDASQNVGIGTASPTALRTKNLEVSSSGTNDSAAVIANKRGTGIATMRLATVGGADGFDINYNFPNTGMLGFYDLSAATTRVAIDSSGILTVGTTTAFTATPAVNVMGPSGNRAYLGMKRETAATSGVCGSLVSYNGSNVITSIDFASNGANNSGFIQTYTWNAGNVSQGPYVNTGGTSWTTASDETLKDIIAPIEDATSKLSGLRTVFGKYKTDHDDVRRIFLIAQDVQPVFPEAVSIDTNGKLGLSYQDLIPVLVAAIKEQQALITQLQADVAALKGATP